MVQGPQHFLERSQELLLGYLQEDREDARELAAARRDFFSGAPQISEPNEARFWEWALFERPLQKYGESPMLHFQDRLRSELPTTAQRFADMLPESIFGVFEVVEDLECLWNYCDLLTQRDYPVRAGGEGMETGARLVVGRLFATGEGEFFLSPATRFFVGNVKLETALREDLAKLRVSNQGTRISQLAFEEMLWPRAAESEKLDETALQEQWDALVSDPAFSFVKVREAIRQAERPGVVVSEILDRIAFNTEIDIDRARILLLHLQSAAKMEQRHGANVAEKSLCPCGSEKNYEDCCRNADAVKAFEEGKARGENIDDLFRQLEASMGIESEENEEGDLTVPVEPELVAIAEEFLWEVKPERGDDFLAMFRYFEQEQDPPIYHLEELHEETFRRYFSVIVPANSIVRDAGRLKALLQNTVRFGLWASLEQGVNLAPVTEELAKSIAGELERIARCQLHLQSTKANPQVASTEPWEIEKIEAERVTMRSLRDRAIQAQDSPSTLARELRQGDIVFMGIDSGAAKASSIRAVFPASAKPFFE